MNSNLENLNPTSVRITINVPYEEYKDKYEEIIDAYAQKGKIKGFRKGKIPRDIVLTHFGQEIRNNVISNIVTPLISQLLVDNKISSLSAAQNLKIDFAIDKPLEISADFEILQQITLPDLSQITIDKPAILSSQLEGLVEAGFNDYVRANCGVFKQAEPDYQIQLNDEVTYVAKLFLRDKEVMQKKKDTEPKKYRLQESKKYKQVNELFLGHKVGDVVEEQKDIESSNPNRAIAGKRVTYKFTILEISKYEAITIEQYLDDLGDPILKTVDDIKNVLRKNLLPDFESLVEAEMRTELLAKLSKALDLKISKLVLEARFMSLIKNTPFYEQLRGKKLDFLHDPAIMSREPYVVLRPTLDRATMDIHESTIISHVVDLEKLTITKDDLREFLKLTLQANGYDYSDAAVERSLKIVTKDSGFMSNANDVIYKSKGYQWLFERVHINELTEEETEKKYEELRQKQNLERMLMKMSSENREKQIEVVSPGILTPLGTQGASENADSRVSKLVTPMGTPIGSPDGEPLILLTDRDAPSKRESSQTEGAHFENNPSRTDDEPSK
ncbi:MAG: hypothetical protein LBE27_03595 [Deltaproteobacteria bacterium]|jgi:trigger factor|nr:hypothetical protein [Deltaproteobacteria bacterium]